MARMEILLYGHSWSANATSINGEVVPEVLESQGAAAFSRPQKSIILNGFSADSNKPTKTHCPLRFQLLRTTSINGSGGLMNGSGVFVGGN